MKNEDTKLLKILVYLQRLCDTGYMAFNVGFITADLQVLLL